MPRSPNLHRVLVCLAWPLRSATYTSSERTSRARVQPFSPSHHPRSLKPRVLQHPRNFASSPPPGSLASLEPESRERGTRYVTTQGPSGPGAGTKGLRACPVKMPEASARPPCVCPLFLHISTFPCTLLGLLVIIITLWTAPPRDPRPIEPCPLPSQPACPAKLNQLS